ncbi:MAG: lytic murein transglycosylase [Devosia sp.]|uniref:lytic murein transglycosylase n=1 Tax=Devosia sp. TaxID=1871048 RepID=UPI0026248999|nr:lytic murein transglycosylase [Devosia sp.]MDB5542032.1 lytic murein transglycosylase [Devosia sp.]
MFHFSRPRAFSAARRSFALGASALVASTLVAPALAGSVDKFVDGIWKRARARGVSRRVFDIAMGDFAPLPKVLELSRKQPEFASTAADYVGKRVTDKQAGTGQAMRGEWAQTLAAVNEKYGVQPEAVLGIWGIETNFGSFMGGTNTVHALATLTHGGYRADYFGNELVTALEILEGGHVRAKNMVGSWAGAMGHPQFMPSSFMKYAVDFRGDGHKDIWGSVPDALASTANYLRSFGWRPGETWGYEVRLPRDFNYDNVWSGITATLADWRGVGVVRANGRAFPRDTDAARLYMPMGGNGPVFAVLANFEVIKRYNNSDSYALAVGHLADRVLGGKTFIAAWPKDTALTASDRMQLQARLLQRGYQIGTPDGVIGPKTRAAVMDYQARAGLLPDGHVSGNLLQALG